MLDMLGRMGILALGTMLTALLPLIAAVAYFVRPSERRLLLMRPLSLAATFAAISGFASGAAIILRGLVGDRRQARAPRRRAHGTRRKLGAGPFRLWVPDAPAWLLIAAGMMRRQP